jgi:hypothetical protein
MVLAVINIIDHIAVGSYLLALWQQSSAAQINANNSIGSASVLYVEFPGGAGD